MSRRRAPEVALLAASILASLAAAEGVLRLLGRGPLQVNPVPGNFWRHDPLLGWSNSPGAEGVFNHPRFRISVHINSKGLRDREYAYEKSPGTRRILVIGDSFVWGYGVEERETLAKVLETALSHVDVINGGVAGYGTDQELLWLRSEGLRYRPDLVILVMCGNDDDENNSELVYNVYHKPRFTRTAQGELVLGGVPVPLASRTLRLKHWLFAHSALLYQVKTGLIDRFRHPRRTVRGSDFGLTLALVDAIDRAARDAGARLAVVTTSRYAPSPTFPYDELVAGLRQRGLLTLDIDHAPGYDAGAMLLPGDAHWNAAGHRFVAQQVMALVEDHHLLENRPGD
jgi:GDSL-like lipase/acylhydrolase family protein